MARSTKLFLMLISFISSTFLQIYAQNICGSIGNRNESRVTERRDQMFYLNTANPAFCSGNITSWRVCYYGPRNNALLNGLRSFWATYAVYRRMGSAINLRYERVSEIFNAVRATRMFINLNNINAIDGVIERDFNCYTDFIDTGDQQLTVQTGDVLGACVFDPVDQPAASRRQLDIVGEISGGSLLAMDAGGCSLTEIPSSIPVNQLSNVNSRRLHLYADIESISPQIVSKAVSAMMSLSTRTLIVGEGPAAPSSSPTAPGSITSLTDDLQRISVTSTALGFRLTKEYPQPTPTRDNSTPSSDTRSKVIVLAAGITVGVVVLLVTVVVVISIATFFSLKKSGQKSYKVTTNAAYIKRSTENLTHLDGCNVVTGMNDAYNSFYNLADAQHDDVMYQGVHEPEDRSRTQPGTNNRQVNLNQNFERKTKIVLKLSFITNSRRGRVRGDQNGEYEYVK